jgi:hypothetical protein
LTNIVRRELGLPETRVRAANPALQTDIVPRPPVRQAAEPPMDADEHR